MKSQTQFPMPREKAAPEWGIKRNIVQSESIVSVGYDDRRLVLEVEFPRAAVYRYFGVRPEHVAGLLAAESIGRHFAANIKGKFECRKVVNETGEPEPWTVDEKPASAKSKEFFLQLCGRAGYISGARDERVNASLAAVARVMGAQWNGTPLVSTWVDGLKQKQIAAGIEWLKGNRGDFT